MHTVHQIGCAPRIQYSTADAEADDETRDFLRKLGKQAIWGLCPYGGWTEICGTRVIFDRAYRPIVRIFSDESTEIVPPDEFIKYKNQQYFHRGFGLSPSAETREIVTRLIARYDLVSELQRRRELLRRKALPRWEGWQ